ncbi:MAG: DUF2335 domain-containing protein [Bacteroidetes bacterium]|nr:DUF2335 domain-containing protein [Bacteroidota bacterium]
MTEELQKDDAVNNGNLAIIEKRLVENDPKIFDGIPKLKKQQIIRSLVVTMHKTHIGPLPDPETLTAYSAIIPNGAERIMQMAEKQLDHRMKMENKVVGGQLRQSNLGQILAFLIGLAALGASTYCIVSGYEWSGGILGVSGLTGLVTAFIKGRSQQEKSLEEKRPRPKR